MELTEVEVILRARGEQLYADFKKLVRESGMTGKQAGKELEAGMMDGVEAAVAEMPKELRERAPLVEREAHAMAKKAASAISQEFERRMRQEDKYRRLGEQIGRDLRQGIERAGTSLTIGVTIPAIAGMKTAINAARDLTEAQNKANVVFGKSIPIVEKFGKTSADAYGISTRAANEYAATFGEILKGTKLAQPELAQMSVQLTKLAGDMASFHNLTIEQSLEKLRSGLVGEVEPLRTLGVLLSDNAVKAKALALGYKGKAEALSDSAKMLIRYQLILEQTKTAQGDMARTADEAANRERRLKAEVENLATKFGNDLMPVYKDVLKTGLDIVHSFQALDPEVRKGIIQWGAYAAAMGPVLKTLTGIFSMIGGIVRMSGNFADAMKGITAAGTGGAALAAGGSVAALGAALHYGFAKPLIEAIQESDKRMAGLHGQSMREMSAGLRMGKSKDQLFKEYLAFKRTTEGPGFERDPAKNNFNLYYGEARRDAVMRIATQIAWDDPTRRKAIQDAGGMPQFGEGDMQGYLKTSATFRALYKEAEAAIQEAEGHLRSH